jgi:PAS domain-containing protein
LRCRRKDGSEFPAEISLSPVHTEEGVQALGIVRDVTERVQQEERFRQVYDAPTDAITFSKDGATILRSKNSLGVSHSP